jgi:hypothetical protein
MRNWLLALTALLGAMSFGPNPARAYYEGPWCAIVDLGPGSSVERCEFWDFESCRQEITGGNRGFCNHNPRYSGAAPPYGPRRRVRR